MNKIHNHLFMYFFQCCPHLVEWSAWGVGVGKGSTFLALHRLQNWSIEEVISTQAIGGTVQNASQNYLDKLLETVVYTTLYSLL